MKNTNADEESCSVERFSTVSSKHSSPSTPSLKAHGEGESGSGEEDGEGGWDGGSEGGQTS
jgi:hypothetical protein